MVEDGTMSKKIDAARKNLSKALKKHAEVVGGAAVSLKKSQRAASAVHTAAAAYVDAVYTKTGLSSPFGEILEPGLEASTLASLAAERDALTTKPINHVV
jgi:predicted TPR repeat methyltransferase